MPTVAYQLVPDPSPEPIFRLSVQQYHGMIRGGLLTDDDPVELLEGVLVFKMPKNPRHRIALAKLQRALNGLVPAGFSVQLQEPITLADGEPEPDAAVIRGQPEDYADRHPGPTDTVLVIEVADTTLSRDRGIKLRSYARAAIRAYWIVNLVDRCVEVFTQPDSGKTGDYHETHIYGESETMDVFIGGNPQGVLTIAEILP
ncbi:MAG: Uma2 family endonuclease [Tepidisphaeraceae bacterium]|jgi:Uma2 family endonuclease